MFCGYQSITDYCINNFTYQYSDVVFVDNSISTTGYSDTTSVIRTDKQNGLVITIGPSSSIFIDPCGSDDSIESLTAWQCYQIFLSSEDATIKPAEISLAQSKQTEKINSDYLTSLRDGIEVVVEGYNPIVLKTSYEDQIHYGNIGALASILYEEDPNIDMPTLLDTNNIAYTLSYSLLNSILLTYFNNFAQKKYIKDNSLFSLKSTTDIDDINALYFCPNKVPQSFYSETSIGEERFFVIDVNPPGICDPPCDYDQCLNCVDGECVSLCNENEYCYNGICETDTCCVYTSSSTENGFAWGLDSCCPECDSENIIYCDLCPPANSLPAPTSAGLTAYRPCTM